MTALIVGGDRLGNIPGVLNENGIKDYIHWTGRKKGLRNKKIPGKVDLVIVLYDFLEHNLTERIKEQTRSREIPCLFSKRSCSDLMSKLNNCSNCKFRCDKN